MQRLRRNHDGYHGETIRVAEVLDSIRDAAIRRGWHIDALDSGGDARLMGLRREANTPAAGPREHRVYLSTGIHGDEPAGPLAVLELLRADAWPAGTALWVCPCLNPSGFERNSRANAAGVDLNRDYRDRRSAEVQAHVAWLERQPDFDLAICLHEDWESAGFYLYELNPDGQPSRAEAVMAAVEPVCPVDRSPVIEGREARGGIIRPQINLADRPDWPEAFHLITHKTRHSHTLEAPSDFPLPVRVAALVTAVRCLLDPPGGLGA